MPIPILAAVRSPFAAADGVLAGWHPVDLAIEIGSVALERAGLDPDDVEAVWVGCDEPVGAQGANAARALILAAGWPETALGTVVEAAPHSGMSALMAACDAIETGRVQHAVVVGMCSASIVQPGASALARLYGRPWGDGPAERYVDDGGLVPPIVAADRAAAALGIERATQESWGLRSIGRRTAPADAIVTVGARPGDAVAVQKDTPIGADALRTIAIDELEPIFEPDGTTTAAGFAPAADGVTVLVLGERDERVAIGEITTAAARAGSPFGPGPAAAAFSAAAPETDRLDLAVASASIALVALHHIDRPADTVDPDGGTIAVGDAAAAEDLRLVVDGLHRTDESGTAVRFAPGAAAGCVWRRL